MVLVIVIPLVVFLLYVVWAIVDQDGSLVFLGTMVTAMVFVLALIVAALIGGVREENFVQVEQYSIFEVDGEFATAYLKDSSLFIEYLYVDKNGLTQIERVTIEEVTIVVYESAEPTVEVYRNKNGTWYALNDDTLQYRLTIPRFNSDIAIPVVRGK